MSYLELARKISRELEGRAAVGIAPSESSCEERPLPCCSIEGVNLPAGVRVLSWQPRQAPVAITTCSVVIDVEKFARATLSQLGHALKGENWLAGNWDVRELVERLEQVGIIVEVEN